MRCTTFNSHTLFVGPLFAIFAISFATLFAIPTTTVTAQVVPGTGTLIDFVGDTLENDEGWDFIYNSPKSSREQDEQTRFPNARSTNQRWFEGPERGYPDSVQVVEAPAGALPGSTRALQVQTLNSGIPGFRNYKVEQDDLVVNGVARVGEIPVGEIPSIVARVYLPSPEKWEDRTGPHFGFRGTTSRTKMTTEMKKINRWRSRPQTTREREEYWPGIWVHFRSATDGRNADDSAFLTVRGNRLGHDFNVREIPVSEFGWWTMGMSFTADGMVHYYAKPGVEDLTEADHLTSQYPYSYRAEKMQNMFFNFCNMNDGKTWSTPFVIDDPKLYVVHAQRIVTIVNNKERAMARRYNQQHTGRSQR